MKSLGAHVRTARRAIRQTETRILRRAGFLKGDWKEALPEELLFWDNALTDPRQNWKVEEYQERTNPNFELQEELRQLIPAPPGAVVRLLDVGAGPLTKLGKRWPGRELQITAVDPLAERYQEIFKRIALTPLVPVSVAHGEKLRELFPTNHFDLAYASNSLDHSYDPLVVISQMLEVVKPSHYVYLWHFANVGVRERYAGLHQWNFDIRGGEVTLGNGVRTHALKTAFAGRAEVGWKRTEAFNTPVIIATLRKSAA